MSFRKILSSLRKADTDYQMISDGDRICVGVSGGKDSVLLLYALEQYRRVKQHYDHCDFSVIGIHLNMGFEGFDGNWNGGGVKLNHYSNDSAL